MLMNSVIGAVLLLNSCNFFIVPLLLSSDKSTSSSTNLISALVPLERVKWNFPPENKNLELPGDFGWQRSKREGRGGGFPGASVGWGCQEAVKVLCRLKQWERGLQGSQSWETSSFLSCWGDPVLPFKGLDQAAWGSGGEGFKTGSLRLAWKPATENGELLCWLHGREQHFQHRWLWWEWMFRKLERRDELLSSVMHWPGCWLDTLCHTDRRTLKELTFTIIDTKPL